jgi:flagellar hook-associated protein 1 FlgK
MTNPVATLSGAARALDAQQTGMAVVGQNIANANTPGYSRRVVDLGTVAAVGSDAVGRGVQVLRIRASRDQLLENRLYREQPTLERESAIADSLGVVEAAFGDPGQSIDADLARFFDSFARLAEDPTGSTARQTVLTEGEALAAGFRDMADRLASSRRDADTAIRSSVTEVNALVIRIAALNASIGSATESQALGLVDEQSEAVRELSELVNINVLQRQGRGVDVYFGAGRPLVVAANSYQLIATPTGPSGQVVLSSNGTTVTSEITSGRVGGLLNVRDTLVPAYETRLDELAFTVVNQVNTLHTAGFDVNGASAGVFFTTLAAQPGAAAAITVNPAVAANTSLIAAASVAVAGNNQTAQAIAALRDARVLDSNQSTMSDAWAQLVFTVGRDVQTASQNKQTRQDVVTQVESLKDASSGVSLDEEALLMLRFQRAYEATARFFQAVDETIDVLLQSVGR